MIPTATVCFMSLTAKRPNGGNSLNTSQQRGFSGFIRTMAESPFLRHSGFSSKTAPVFLSILHLISTILQATWAQLKSIIGVYPALMDPGWFIMIIWAMKVSACLGGQLLVYPSTHPLLISLALSFKFIPTLNPGGASVNFSWCISIPLTWVFKFPGEIVAAVFSLRIPV